MNYKSFFLRGASAVCDTTLFSKFQRKWILVTDPCICLWDSKHLTHQDKTGKKTIHSTSLHFNKPTTGAELIWGGPTKVGQMVGLMEQFHYRRAITATARARQDHQMINFTHCQPVPAGGGHSICLYVKPWWLCVHSICNPMQAPGGKGVLPTALEQQRNWLQAVACVGTVQRKDGFMFKA